MQVNLRTLLLCLVLGAIPWASTHAQRIYVDIDAAGNDDGSSWTDAYNDLQDAIDAAAAGDEIWVADGTYLPTVPFDPQRNGATADRFKTFLIVKDDLKLYGGFAGGETMLSQRVLGATPTILSGDLGVANDTSDNAFQVMFIDGGYATIDNNTRIDGFIITHGVGDTTTGVLDRKSVGGAMFIQFGSPVIANCDFVDNAARDAGAVAISGTFVSPQSMFGTPAPSAPRFENCSFRDNLARGIGGAVQAFSNNQAVEPVFEDCEFIGNRAGTEAGAVKMGQLFLTLTGTTKGTFRNCRFEQNRASLGGAIYNQEQSSVNNLEIVNCEFVANHANTFGGALGGLTSGGGYSDVTVVSSSFVNNTADRQGGAIYFRNNGSRSSRTFVNCLMANNSVAGIFGQAGGAMSITSQQVSGRDTTSIINSTITENTAALVGGGIFLRADAGSEALLTIANSIVWNNSAAGVANTYLAQIDADATTGGTQNLGQLTERITYSTVNGFNTASGLPGAATNLKVDPQFSDPANGDYNMLPTSPAIDAGINDSIPAGITTDLVGNNRIRGGTVDMGALEQPVDLTAVTRFYVDLDATAGLNDGSNWANAFLQLSDALDVVTAGDTVWVAEGTYVPQTEFDADGSGGSNPLERTFYVDKNGVKIYGGFEGTETMAAQRNPAAHPTILSGDLGGFNFVYHVLYIDGTTSNGNISGLTEIDGFTLTKGGTGNRGGGAVFVNGSGAGNQANPSFTNCRFTNNHTSGTGGAIYNNGQNGTASPRFVNCLFRFNSSGSGGGAVSNVGIAGVSSPSFTNCTFFGNSDAEQFGNVMINTAIANGTSAPVISNCIVWQNNSNPSIGTLESQIVDLSGAQSQISFSLVEFISSVATPPASWTNNIDSDPLFRNPNSGNLELQINSPALNAGSNAAVPAGITTDLNGDDRIQQTTVDMGAFEFGQNIPAPPTIACKDSTYGLPVSGALAVDLADLVTASQPASGVSFAYTPSQNPSLGCSDVGTPISVQIEISDIVGQSASCSQTITVVDTVKPTMACQNISRALSGGSVTITAADVDNGTNDACGLQPLSIDKTDFGCGDIGPNNVVLTATDNNGNSNSCTVTVTITGGVPDLVATPPAGPICPSQVLGLIFNDYLADNNNAADQFLFFNQVPSGQSPAITIPTTNGDIGSATSVTPGNMGNPNALAISKTTYFVEARDNTSGCFDTVKLELPIPTAGGPGDVIVCAGATVPGFALNQPAIYSNNNPFIGLPTFGFGNLPTFVAQNPTASPITATITAYGFSGTCGATGPITFTVTVVPSGQGGCRFAGEAELNETGLLAYPNPFSDHVTLVRDVTERQTFVVLDMQGRTVRSGNLAEGETTHRIELSGLAAGVYTLRVGGEAVRLVKE